MDSVKIQAAQPTTSAATTSPSDRNATRMRPFTTSAKPTRNSATARTAITVVYCVERSFQVTRVSASAACLSVASCVLRRSSLSTSRARSPRSSPCARARACRCSAAEVVPPAASVRLPAPGMNGRRKAREARSAAMSSSRPSAASCSTLARSAATAVRVVSRAVLDSLTLALVCTTASPAPSSTIEASATAIQRVSGSPGDSSSPPSGGSFAAALPPTSSSVMRRSPLQSCRSRQRRARPGRPRQTRRRPRGGRARPATR